MVGSFHCPVCGTDTAAPVGNCVPSHERPAGGECPASGVRPAVVLTAARLAGRRSLNALRSNDAEEIKRQRAEKAKGKSARGSVRSVSGGLPTLGKDR